MADIEIRAFGLRFLGVLSKIQILALFEKQQDAEEPEVLVSNTGGAFEPAETAEALYRHPWEEEEEVRFGFRG